MGELVFGTDGWRAVIAEEFTFANVRRVAAAIAGHVLRTHGTTRPVLVGHDTRFMARDFARTVVGVLRHHGLEARLTLHDVPTPVIAHAAQHVPTAGAVMLTASHNPPQYCGIKYIPEYAGPATKDITDAIVAGIRPLDETLAGIVASEGEPFDPEPAYKAEVLARFDRERITQAGLKVAYDAMHATGRGYTDAMLESLGCHVTALRTQPDPLFGGGMPEPAPAYLGQLREVVVAGGLALGLANDGDSDRFGVLGEDGSWYTPNQVIALLARHLHVRKGRSGAIVRTVATTHMLDRMAERWGLPLRETPVGFKWVGQAMREETVLIGGEESGGLSVIDHIPEKDGILADLLVAEMVAWEGKPLSAIWAELVAEVGGAPVNRRLDLHLDAVGKDHLMAAFKDRTPASFAGLAVKEVSTLDGVKWLLEGGAWVLARPSGTEPVVRIYLEAAEAETLARLENACRSMTQVAAH
ncbi:MAG: phosphoglucomutase/phosphomannomutase family protein [Candidatus Sericytochromatia bacterium]|nr:phosphoglucomutase/phosphomannomutase family protein [Candidatus Sericytochromatia bacterium]